MFERPVFEIAEDEEEEDWAAPSTFMSVHGNFSSPSNFGISSRRIQQTLSKNTVGSVKSDMDVVSVSKFENDLKRTIIQIDIDCFYAQVEMIRNPALKGKPLGIQQKYLLVTCNYEARKYGVTKLMGIKEALQKCPHLSIVNGEDLTHYRNMSYKITDLLMQYSPQVERLGFDENFIDVSNLVTKPQWSSLANQTVPGHIYNSQEGSADISTESGFRSLCIGAHIAAAMRQTLKEELGITCCAGIAHNKLLAKLVAGINKPDQQTLLPHHHASHLVESLGSIRKLPGIGRSTASQLADIGVATIHDLRNISVSALEGTFSKSQAIYMVGLADGIDNTIVVPTGQPQSMSDEDSFKRCSDVLDAKKRISQMLENLIHRLLDDGRVALTLRLTVRKYNPAQWTRESRQCSIPPHIYVGLTKDNTECVRNPLLTLSMALFEKLVPISRPFHLTLINVCLTKLEKPDARTKTISHFFGTTAESSRSPCLKFMDKSDGLKTLSPDNTGKPYSVSNAIGTNNSAVLLGSLQDFQKVTSPDNSPVISSKDDADCLNASPKTYCLPVTPTRHSEGLPKSKKRKSSELQITGFFRKKPKTLTDHTCEKRELSQICLNEAGKKDAERAGCSQVKDPVAALQPSISSPVRVPPGVDASVFAELPPDIQKELLQQSGILSHLPNLRPEEKCDRELVAQHSEGEQFKAFSNICEPDISSKRQLSSPSASSGKVCATVSNESAIKDQCNVSPRCVKENHLKCDFDHTNKEYGQTCSEHDLKTIELPPHIDPDVFWNLPQDVRKDLLANWKVEKTPKTLTKSQNTNTITNYFNK